MALIREATGQATISGAVAGTSPSAQAFGGGAFSHSLDGRFLVATSRTMRSIRKSCSARAAIFSAVRSTPLTHFDEAAKLLDLGWSEDPECRLATGARVERYRTR